MRVIFIDHENVGFNTLDKINPTGLDKVLVFSHQEKVKRDCALKHYRFFGDYPKGKNQADFAIIAELAKEAEKIGNVGNTSSYEFVVSTNDCNLIEAFKHQCNKKHNKFTVVKANATPKINSVNYALTPNRTKKILAHFDTPDTLANIRSRVGLPDREFSKVTHQLIQKGLIRRLSKSSKKWLSNGCYCEKTGVLA